MNINALLNLDGQKLILASASPRRASLLTQVGFEFEVKPSEVDEDNEVYTIPENHVLELSYKKAAKVAELVNEGLIIGADTIVVLEKDILGKPRNAGEARTMLARLSGNTHAVFTGLTILDKASGRIVTEYERTDVTFRSLSENEIGQYVATRSSLDKAGSYGIQDSGALFVSRVEGCFYNVMGFPLTKFYTTLRTFLN